MHRTGARIVSAPVTSPAEPAPQPAPGDDTDHSPGPKRGHRTWPERLTIATTFLAAALCFVVAAALVGGYLIARQRNVVDLEDPSQRAVAQVAAGAAPIVVLAGGDETTTPATTTAASRPPPGCHHQHRDGAGAAATAAAASGVDTAAVTTEGSPPAATAARHRRRARSDGDVPTGRPRGAELPHHRRRQRRMRRSELAVRRRLRRPRETWASAATRSWSCASTRRAERVAVLSFPRDLYVEIADTGQQVADQLGVRARRPAEAGRHDLRQLRDRRSTTTSRSTSAPSRRSSTPSAACRCRSSTRPVTPTPGSTSRQAGCYTFDGEPALAYVRSRYYEYEDPPGQRRLAQRRHERPRAHLAPAGLPAPRRSRASSTRARSTRASPAA